MFSWRKWKQKVRRQMKHRREMAFLIKMSMLILIIYVATLLYVDNESIVSAQQFTKYKDEETLSDIYNNKQSIRVIIHRSYICGDEVEELGYLSYEDSLVLMMENPGWELTTDERHSLIRLVEKIDDLSSYCKEHAYFGVSKMGDLSLFDGLPKYEKVIKTFFQLNIPYMESMIDSEELQHLLSGIKVNDIDEYESVIDTFSEYSIDRADTVRRPYY